MEQDTSKLGSRFTRGGHTIELQVEAEALEKQRKKCVVALKQPAGREFTIFCDEGPYLDGDDTAPPPLAYLSSSLGF